METLKFIEKLADQSPANIRSNLYKKGILGSYDNSDGRMVLYSSKNKRFNTVTKGGNQALSDECNGLVVDTKNLKVLATPPEAFRSNVNAHVLDKHLCMDLYDLYRVEDGTLINLYYWEPLNSWRISTARSYDITDIKWGTISYKEIVKNLLAVNNTDDETFYGSLDKDTSYTFGFKHSSMHPFQEGLGDPINKLWFIQSVKNNEVSYEFENEFQIPNQTKFEFPEGVPKTSKYLFGTLNHSLDNFINNTGDGVLYGYILRTKNKAETGDHSSILLESSLLQKIRQLYYHSNFSKFANEMKYDRELYTITFAYLNINSHTTFINLFPQYRPQYDKLDAITADLVKKVMTYSNNPSESNLPMNSNIRFIYESLNNKYRIVPHDRRNIKLISTFLLGDHFTDLYYSLLST